MYHSWSKSYIRRLYMTWHGTWLLTLAVRRWCALLAYRRSSTVSPLANNSHSIFKYITDSEWSVSKNAGAVLKGLWRGYQTRAKIEILMYTHFWRKHFSGRRHSVTPKSSENVILVLRNCCFVYLGHGLIFLVALSVCSKTFFWGCGVELDMMLRAPQKT